MDCSMPGFPVYHQLPELAQTHVHRVGDATQPSHPLLSHSPSALSLSQYQGLFQWLSSSYQMAIGVFKFYGEKYSNLLSVRIYYTIVCCIMFLYSPHSYISVDSWWYWEGESKLIFHPKVCSFVSLSIWILWEVPCQIVNRKKDTAKSCLTFAIPWTIACQVPNVRGILQAWILE